jgi:predicted AAA+ superfamily ATPase
MDRAVYLLRHFPALVLLGSRQVGKTTLAKAIQQELNKPAVYFDLENDRDYFRFELDAQSILEENMDKLVIIDEIQRLPRLFALLRSMIDLKKKPGRFLLLGSASPDLLKGVSESLAGRVSYLDLFPFSITEVLPDQIDMKSHWFRGGYPDALLSSSDELAFQWLDDYIKSYIERDLAQIYQIQLQVTTVRNFWSMLASSNGTILNAESYARSLGVTGPTVVKYLNLLEGAYLVTKLQPWFVNVKKRVVKSPKVYISDSGILHKLNYIDSWQDLQRNLIIGASWEGYVIQQIRQSLPKEHSLYYYRTQNGAEADLVIAKGNKPIALCEIKFSETPKISRGFYECMEDLKTQKNFVITPSSEVFINASEGIVYAGLIPFLQDYLLQLSK